jgi:hypothetical protein
VKFCKSILVSFGVPFFLAATALIALAQSSDQELPTAVLSNEIKGRIVALDLGDSRLTRHFYAFEATPGDLVITVNSRNLNGDVDIFTAVNFRPLTKISVYANTIPPEVTKSLYFRTRQILILRVEARTPNDDPGVYRITFGGTFQAFSGGIRVAEAEEEEAAEESQSTRKNKRLSSVGATIEQPAPEVKEEVKTPEVAAEKPPEEKATPKKTTPTTRRTSPNRTARGRPTGPARPKPAPPDTAKTKTPDQTSEENKPATEGEEKSADKPSTEKPVTQEAGGTHLIIERTDGTRIDRPMSTVRRVIVEGTAIVIVMKTGRIDRIPMSLVVRMAIEP